MPYFGDPQLPRALGAAGHNRRGVDGPRAATQTSAQPSGEATCSAAGAVVIGHLHRQHATPPAPAARKGLMPPSHCSAALRTAHRRPRVQARYRPPGPKPSRRPWPASPRCFHAVTIAPGKRAGADGSALPRRSESATASPPVRDAPIRSMRGAASSSSADYCAASGDALKEPIRSPTCSPPAFDSRRASFRRSPRTASGARNPSRLESC